MNWYKQAVSRSRKLETIAKYLTTIVFHSLKQFKNENSFYIQELSLNVSYKVFFLKSLKKNEPPVVDGAYFPTTNSIHIRIGISQEDVGYYNNYNSIIYLKTITNFIIFFIIIIKRVSQKHH